MSKDFNGVITEASSKKAKEKQTEDLVQFVVFSLDSEEYAVPIEDLKEIIKIPEIAPVPNSPDFIKGILNLRGTIVVVIDLEKRFHLVRKNKTESSHIIITEVGNSTFGLIVDEVSEVARVETGKIQSAPSLVSSKINADYLKGVVVLEGSDTGSDLNVSSLRNKVSGLKSESKKRLDDANSRLIIILDLPKMLDAKELLEVGALVDGVVKK